MRQRHPSLDQQQGVVIAIRAGGEATMFEDELVLLEACRSGPISRLLGASRDQLPNSSTTRFVSFSTTRSSLRLVITSSELFKARRRHSMNKLNAVERRPRGRRIAVIDVLEIAELAVVDKNDDVARRFVSNRPDPTLGRKESTGQALRRRRIVRHFKIDGRTAAVAASDGDDRRGLDAECFNPREVGAQDEIEKRALVALQGTVIVRLHVDRLWPHSRSPLTAAPTDGTAAPRWSEQVEPNQAVRAGPVQVGHLTDPPRFGHCIDDFERVVGLR